MHLAALALACAIAAPIARAQGGGAAVEVSPGVPVHAGWSLSPTLSLFVPPGPGAGKPWIWSPVAAPVGTQAGTSYLLCGPPGGSGAGCTPVYVTPDGMLALAPARLDTPLFLPTTELVLRRSAEERAGPGDLRLEWSNENGDRRILWTVAGASFALGALGGFALPIWVGWRRRRSRATKQERIGAEGASPEPSAEEAAKGADIEPAAAFQAPGVAGRESHGAAPPDGRWAPPQESEISTVRPVSGPDPRSQPSSTAGSCPSSYPSAGTEEPMGRLARAYWRDRGLGLAGLRKRAKSSELELFEWRRFDDVLRVPAASAVLLEFVSWDRGSTGPVFLGRSTGSSLLLVPTSSTAFGSDQGLSALRALFELQPDPRTKTFEFRDLVRPCRLRSEGAGYRLVEKGVVRTDAEDRGVEGGGTATSSVSMQPLPPSGRTAADHPAPSSEQTRQIEKLVQLAKQTQTLLQGLHDSSALRRGATLDERSLERIRGVVSEELAASMQQPHGAAHPAGDRSRLPSPASPDTWRSEPQDVSATPPWPSGPRPELQPSRPRPGSEAPRPLPTSWIEAILQRSRFAPPFGKRRYLEDLHQLGATLRQEAPAPSWNVSLFQVRLGQGGRLGLDPVELGKDAQGDLQIFRAGGGSLPEYLSWEVMLGLSVGSPDPPGRLALLYPWSRHGTGAPHLAQELVVGAANPGLPDVVRCTAPAELEATGEERLYTVVRKLSIVPVESA